MTGKPTITTTNSHHDKAAYSDKTTSSPEIPDEKTVIDQTAQPGQFLAHWINTIEHPEQTLLLLDIDDTLITTPPKQLLGRSELFYDYLRRERDRQPHKTKAEIANQIDPLLIAIYERTSSILTDKALPDVIKKIRNKGVTVLGITSRGERLWSLTEKQLAQQNIAFSSITTEKQFLNGDKAPINIHKGIIFASHGNTKGETVNALIKTGWLNASLKQVVMIDDLQRHLNSVGYIIKSHPSLSFKPVLCIVPQVAPPYNPSEAERQIEKFLWQWKADPAIQQLIQDDPFTQQVLNNCCKKSTRSGVQCNHLKQNILKQNTHLLKGIND